MTLLVPSSRTFAWFIFFRIHLNWDSVPSSVAPATRVSWSVWVKKIPMSGTRPKCCRGRSTPTLITQWWSPIKTWHSYPQVPYWAWYRHQLGWYGKDLAPYLLQRTACCPRGTPSSLDRSSAQSQSQSWKDDPNHVWDFQYPSLLRVYPSCTLFVRLWSDNWYCIGFRWWCYPHCSYLWGIFNSSCHPSYRSRWSRFNRSPYQEPHRTWLSLHYHSRTWNRSWHQREAMLRRPRFRSGAADCCSVLCSWEELWASWWSGYHHWKWAVWYLLWFP